MRSSPLTIYILIPLLVSCSDGPSEEEIKNQFNRAVSAANYCDIDDQCSLVAAGCPLGCQVAVNINESESIRKLAEKLIRQYEAGGRGCAYSCIPPGTPVCIDHQCIEQ